MIEKGGVIERYHNGSIRVELRPIEGRNSFYLNIEEKTRKKPHE